MIQCWPARFRFKTKNVLRNGLQVIDFFFIIYWIVYLKDFFFECVFMKIFFFLYFRFMVLKGGSQHDWRLTGDWNKAKWIGRGGIPDMVYKTRRYEEMRLIWGPFFSAGQSFAIGLFLNIPDEFDIQTSFLKPFIPRLHSKTI